MKSFPLLSALLYILVFTFILPSSYAECPTGLLNRCACTEDPSKGTTVKCSNVARSDVFASLRNASIAHLTMTNCPSSRIYEPISPASLKALELVECDATDVDDKMFSAVADSLEKLGLSRCKLTTIPNLNLPRLTSLSLMENLIKDVPEGVFSPFPSLKELRMGGNQICSLSRMALNETKARLELLDLSSNCMTTIPTESLRNANRLKHLDLSGNKIVELGGFSLMNLPSLRELRLNGNLLSRIMPLAFLNVPQLQSLSMSDNSLISIDGLRLQSTYLTKLEMLDVRNNKLSWLPTLIELPQLKQVNLDGNLISRVDSLSFSSNPKLQLISLQGNAITTVAKNSFDSLDNLAVILLSNNAIESFEQGTFNGKKSLQQLYLRNNSLVEVNEATFAQLANLESLDLAHNHINKIEKGSFGSLTKLSWLDLSGNELTGLEKGTLSRRIGHVLLNGNPLYCDEKLDWLVQWLITNKVTTSLYAKPEVVCAGPPNFAGVRLKELMMKRANDTMTVLGLNRPSSDAGTLLLNHFLPGLSALPGMGGSETMNGIGGVPGLNMIANSIPALRGLNLGQLGQRGQFNSPVDQFAAPLLRMAAGGEPNHADIEQMVQAIPKMIMNMPGTQDFDVRQLPPNVIAHVFRGGQIPGVQKEVLDRIVALYTAKMAEMASALERGEEPANIEKYLPPLDHLPPDMVTAVIQGDSLPGLTQSQTAAIREYYTRKLPIVVPPDFPATMNNLPINHQTLEIMKMLPAGYNISRIPVQVIEGLIRGEVPDFALLPLDLQEHLKAQSDKMINMFAKDSQGNSSIEDVLVKLPRWDRPVLPTYSPYDIDRINEDLVAEEAANGKAAQLRFYGALTLGAVAVLSLAIVTVLCVRRRRAASLERDTLLSGSSDPSTGPSKSPSSGSYIVHNIHNE